MKNFFPAREIAGRVFVWASLAVGVCGLLACQTSAPAGNGVAAASAGTREQSERIGNVCSAESRDLSRDEAAGGHILRKHVGQSDEQLRERLGRERHISGASTYTDRGTAERTVGAAIAQSQDRIEHWLSRPGGHPNLVLDYDSRESIGRTLNRGEGTAHPCSHALVVLRYSGPNDYYVLTSYPECRS
jgi:hypothetical protein